jgi:hypothetical protein
MKTMADGQLTEPTATLLLALMSLDSQPIPEPRVVRCSIGADRSMILCVQPSSINPH